MASKESKPVGYGQQYIAYGVLIFSGILLVILGVAAITVDTKNNAMTIFNVLLPVVSSWVGTVLAFYFGRENVEAANQQVRDLVQRLSPEQIAKSPVNSIMRSFDDTIHIQIPAGKDDKDIKLSSLIDKFDGKLITRLPVVNIDKNPKYMIHESKVDKYLAAGGKKDDTLEKFIALQKKNGTEFGLNRGFVIVSEDTTIVEAKRKMEEFSTCQDIFISKKGATDEPLIGWISNMRLGKYLEA